MKQLTKLIVLASLALATAGADPRTRPAATSTMTARE